MASLSLIGGALGDDGAATSRSSCPLKGEGVFYQTQGACPLHAPAHTGVLVIAMEV